jgi:hypothetical protein
LSLSRPRIVVSAPARPLRGRPTARRGAALGWQ